MSPLLDTGTTCTIQGAVVRFKEPSFRAFLTQIVPKLGFLSKVLPGEAELLGETDSEQTSKVENFLTRLMADDTSWEILTGFLSVCSDKPAEFFKDVTLTEAFDIFGALQKLNLGRVYSVFQQAARQNLPQASTAPKAPTE